MRLGAYPARLAEGSLVAEDLRIDVGHRTAPPPLRGEQRLPRPVGVRRAASSGTSPDASLVEFVELDSSLHPFVVATQAHPEFKSRPTRPHPLFFSFVRAALDYLESERLPIDDADQSETPGSAGPGRER